MWWWWWWWVVLVIVLFALPWGYGWGRRGWGPPYPTYYRRRYYGRTPAAAPGDLDPAAEYPVNDRLAARDVTAPQRTGGQGWTWLADLLWLGVLAAIGWAIYLWVT